MIGVSFGEYALQSPSDGRIVTETNVYDPPANKIQADQLAEADGALIVKQQYQSKTFTVTGIVRKSTRAEIEAALDEFKAAMAVKNQAFDIDYAGSTRRYLANAQNTTIAMRLTSFAYTIEFLSPDGMGWDLDTTTLLSDTSTTDASATFAVTPAGTYRVEPLIIVTVNTVTGGTNKTVTVSNGTTLRGLSVTRNWANGDVLEIDSLNKTVYVNNVAVAFSGQFPRWEIGETALAYIDDFTTRDFAIQVSYTRRYL